MPINQFIAPKSPIDAIAGALKVADQFYGIKKAGAVYDQLTQNTEQEKTTFEQGQEHYRKLQDPESSESRLIKSDANSYLQNLTTSEYGKKNPTAFKPMLDLINAPETTGADVKNALENSPLLKQVTSMANKDTTGAWLARGQDIRNQNSQDRIQISGSKQYDSQMKPYESTLQALSRSDKIINDIKSGDLKSTKLLRTDLTSALGSAFNQGKSATVYSMSHADLDSAYGRINDFLQRYSGKPMNTIPPELLDQMQKDVQALKDTYRDAHEVAYSSLREGFPSRLKTSMDERFNKFREKSGLPIANLEASGPVSSPVSKVQSTHPQDSEAVQWAKQNPNDPRAAKILELNGAK